MSANLGKQLASLVALTGIMSRLGIQPGGVLFGSVLGFGAGNIARDYGVDVVETTSGLVERGAAPAPSPPRP